MRIREVFITDKDTFKLGITRIGKWNFKIHISKKIEGQWKLQNRHLKEADDFVEFEFIDWNHDDFLDLRIKFINGPKLERENFLFLFEPSKKCFFNVEKYWWFCGSYSDEVYIADSDSIYFSFTALGCSGDYYQSNLFTIRNYNAIDLGYAEIEFCDQPFRVVIHKHNIGSFYNQIVTIPGKYIFANYNYGDDAPWFNYMCHYWKKYYIDYIN